MGALLTTSVGSFPKPPYLRKARGRYSRGEMDRQELRELELQATREWIEAQEEIGIDILVDGEMDRGDMVTYFAENLDGFAISGLVPLLRQPLLPQANSYRAHQKASARHP